MISVTLPADEAAWPRPAVAGSFMLVMLVAATFSFIHRYVPAILVDPIRAELKISDLQFSLLQGTAFAVFYAAASLVCGVLADRTVRRNLLVAGVTAWTVGTVLFGTAKSFEGLLFSRCLVGLGEAALGPASVSLLCDFFAPEKRGRAIAVSFFGATLGSSLAFTLGGWMLEAARAGQFAALPWVGDLSPWRQVVVLLGTMGLLLVPALLLFPEPSRRTPTRLRGGDGVRALWSRRDRVGPVIAAGAMVALADFGFSIWITALLTRSFHFAHSLAGSLLGAVALLSGIGGGWLGGVLCDRAHRRGGSTGRVGVVRLAAIAMLASGAILCLPFGAAAVASFACWQVAANVAYVGCASVLQDLITDRTRGLAAALSLCASIGFGLGLGPTSVAALNQVLGRGSDALASSLLIVLSLAGALLLGSALLLEKRLRRASFAASIV